MKAAAFALAAFCLIGAARADSLPVMVGLSQNARATTASDGTFSVTLARAFVSTTPAIQATPLGGGTAPQVTNCQIDSVTNPTTSPVVAGHCSTTSGNVALNGAAAAAASGVTVMVTAADRTQ